MTITLTNGGTTIALDPDLLWSDEFDWHPVEQSQERSITGALIVQASVRVAGRPITLQPEDERSAWTSRATLEQLQDWAGVPGMTFTLALRGEIRNVIFRHQDTAIEAKPLVHFSDVDAADNYLVTYRFMEI